MVPTISSPPSLSITEADSLDLGDPLSDEDDLPMHSNTKLVSPVPEMVCNRSSELEMVIKSEPVENIEASTSQSSVPMPYQLVEHSYSYMDHIGLLSSDQHPNLQISEEDTLSRTSGSKYAGDVHSVGIRCSRYFGEDDNGSCSSVVVQLRKKRAPPITNRLIIPVVRVPRYALTERNVMDSAVNEMDVADTNFDGHAATIGALLCISVLPDLVKPRAGFGSCGFLLA